MKMLMLMMAVFSASYSISAFAGEWIADDRTQCRVWNSNPGPNESIKWSGSCSDGKASGKGILQWYKNGASNGRYEGDFFAGKRHGKGINTDPDGSRYEGNYFDDMMHGKGIIILPNGNRYEGDFFDSKPHGKGIRTLPTGASYEGGFFAGKLHGKGILTFPDGSRQEIEFRDGKEIK
jgi:hypothetical protein